MGPFGGLWGVGAVSGVSHGLTPAQQLEARERRERQTALQQVRRRAARAAEDAAVLRQFTEPLAAVITDVLRQQLQQEGDGMTDEERAAAEAAARQEAVARSLQQMRQHLGLHLPPQDDGGTVSAAGLAAERTDGDPAVAAALARMRGQA